MSILDKVKELLGKNADGAESALGKARDIVNDKTGGKYTDQVDTAQEKAKEFIEGQRHQDQPPA